MADISTIARPYAEALYKVLIDSTELSSTHFDEVTAWLAGLSKSLENESLVQFIRHPNALPEDILDILLKINPVDVDVAPALAQIEMNFMRVIVDAKRFEIIPFLLPHFLQWVHQRTGIMEARVESAFPLSESEKSTLLESLERKFLCKLRITESVLPSLIGGVRVTVGDEVLDGSIHHQIERLRGALLA
ncbi:MAG: ATP synthase F1 subunit delta [Gammaproteobacteria bacterium]|nr:ATP synthase F1 subunit delta [Gammaproteobacteria bacterium]